MIAMATRMGERVWEREKGSAVHQWHCHDYRPTTPVPRARAEAYDAVDPRLRADRGCVPRHVEGGDSTIAGTTVA